MTNSEKEIFLELLQASVWEREPNLSLFQGEWHWEVLFRAFMKHDLLGIVADTIIKLPDMLKPSMEMMTYLYNYLGNLLQGHYKLNNKLAEILPHLEAVGCHPVLLKGQGLSVLYPKQCLRDCGDLDIYVGQDKMEDAKNVINSLATKEEVGKATEHCHEYHIELSDITIELHRAPGHTPNNRYLDKYLTTASSFLQPESLENVMLPIGSDKSVKVEVPPVDFNVWYVFNHLVSHFCKAGVGYRLFCDWLIVIREFNRRGTLTHDQLKSILESIGLLRAWQILGGILVYKLGLPEKEFPLFNEHMARKSLGFVSDEIMGGSRFFFASLSELQSPRNPVKHLLFMMHYYFLMSRPHFVLTPITPYTIYCKYLTVGVWAYLFKK